MRIAQLWRIRKIKLSMIVLAIICLIGYCLWVRCFVKQQTLYFKLQSLSFSDRMYLEAFFRSLLSQEDGSYVLFGSKPVSVMFNKKKEEGFFQLKTYGFLTSFDRTQKGCEVWQKYRHLFPLKKEYALIHRNFGTLSAIFLIHKMRLLAVLDQYFSDFQNVFTNFQSPQELLEALVDNPIILEDIWVKSDVLFGILLGFGKENAEFFQRKKELSSLGSDGNLPFFQPKPRPGFITLEEELVDIERRADSPIAFEEEEKTLELMLHWPQGFLVDTSQTDLVKLRARLKQERIQATQAYAKGNFLEVTLRTITEI